MVNNPKIFFLHTGQETFVHIDHDLLATFANVDDFHARRKFPFGFVRYWRGIAAADLVFCWFAGWNSLWALLLARLLSKPSILVIGGYDLANLPEADYGNQRGGLPKWVTRAAIALAGALFTNSYYSQQEAFSNAGVAVQRVNVIYHGVPDPFGALPALPKDRMALTVGNLEWANLKRKGLEPFVRAAAALPDIQFVLVGAWKDDAVDYLRSIASPNVEFTGRVSDEQLLDTYRRASVYVQASLHEGFGLSVAEAMLAGCVPVVTRNGSLPEVVGECGVYTVSPAPGDLSAAVAVALESPAELCLQARNRILREFSLEQRGCALSELVASLLGKKI
jgi:glycosyltransferase involved in cell wall biosynthesis